MSIVRREEPNKIHTDAHAVEESDTDWTTRSGPVSIESKVPGDIHRTHMARVLDMGLQGSPGEAGTELADMEPDKTDMELADK